MLYSRTGLGAAAALLLSTSMPAAAATVQFFQDRTAFEAALGTFNVIDFEGFTPPGTTLNYTGNESLIPDFNFSGQGLHYVDRSAGWSGNPYDSDFLSGGSGGSTSITITPNLTLNAFGAEFADTNSGNSGTLTLTGNTGQLFNGTYSVTDLGNGAQSFFGWIVTGDVISQIDYVMASANYTAIDNIVYSGSATLPPGPPDVPLPASAALLAVALAGGWHLQKR